MSKRSLAGFMLIAALGLGTPLLADHGNGKGHDKHDDGGWERRDGYEYHTYGEHENPPGWSKGKKTGWGHCDVPPGHPKPADCK